jgi:hypothetical protein
MVYADHPSSPELRSVLPSSNTAKSRIRLRNRALVMEEHIPS